MQTPNGPRNERIHVGVYVDDLATIYGAGPGRVDKQSREHLLLSV